MSHFTHREAAVYMLTSVDLLQNPPPPHSSGEGSSSGDPALELLSATMGKKFQLANKPVKPTIPLHQFHGRPANQRKLVIPAITASPTKEPSPKIYSSSTSTSRAHRKLCRTVDVTTGKAQEYLAKLLRRPDPSWQLSPPPGSPLAGRSPKSNASPPKLATKASEMMRLAAQCDQPQCAAFREGVLANHEPSHIPTITPYRLSRRQNPTAAGNDGNAGDENGDPLKPTFDRLAQDHRASYYASLNRAFYSQLSTSSVPKPEG